MAGCFRIRASMLRRRSEADRGLVYGGNYRGIRQFGSGDSDFWNSHPTTAVDSWGFGCLIHEIFNGPFSRPEDLGPRGNIPQVQFLPSGFHLGHTSCSSPILQDLKIYKPLMNPNPKGRMDLCTFLEQNFGRGGYFENDFVSVNLFLEQIAIKDSHEKDQFLRWESLSLANMRKVFCYQNYRTGKSTRRLIPSQSNSQNTKSFLK